MKAVNPKTTKKTLILAALVLFLVITILYFNFSQDIEPSYKAELIVSRKSKDKNFQTLPYPDSPIPAELRKQFEGLDYYEPNPDCIFQAHFERDDKGHDASPLGDSVKMIPAGKVRFSFENKEYSLTAFWQSPDSDKSLFIPFKDPTNKNETYPGGRFMDVSLQQDGKVELDFNLCYNPYCAYSDKFICPVPPPENTLPFPIKAGEKRFPLSFYK
jgi:uncharacterized protein (DUF1684 family)